VSQDRRVAALVRWSGRPTLFAVAVMNVITGLRFRIPITIQPMKAIAAVTI